MRFLYNKKELMNDQARLFIEKIESNEDRQDVAHLTGFMNEFIGEKDLSKAY
jgi:hypothetical protein